MTSTLRNAPTNVAVGPEEGLDHESVAVFDSVASVPKSVLTVHLGALGAHRRIDLCRALEALADC